jgi:hypothetical protein
VYGTAATGAGAGVIGRHLGATGSGPGVKGVTSSPTGSAVLGLNLGGGPGLSSVVNSGVAPLSVNSDTKVAKLNADKLDGSDASDFLHDSVPLSLTGSTATDGVITGTNTGSANGVQGVTGAAGASGVYGQNNSAGYGVAGRSNGSGGVGVYAEATGGGGSVPLELHSGASSPPMRVDSDQKVDNLNADKVDGLHSNQLVIGDQSPGAAARGGRILANRLVSGAPGQILLNIPYMGRLTVESCESGQAQLAFDTAGTGVIDVMFSGIDWSGIQTHTDAKSYITDTFTIPDNAPDAVGTYTINIARDTWNSTKIATIWVSWDATPDCRFQAQALQSPQL